MNGRQAVSVLVDLNEIKFIDCLFKCHLIDNTISFSFSPFFYKYVRLSFTFCRGIECAALYLVFAFQKMKKQYNDKGEVEYV